MNRWPAVLLVSLWLMNASEASADPGWANRGATPIAAGRLELGVLSEARYGLTDRLELFSHALTFWVEPQLGARTELQRLGRWRFGSEHALSYPSLLLNLIAKEGSLGLLPGNSDIPPALLIRNELVASLHDSSNWLVAGRIGITLGPRFSSGEGMPLLDFPLLYPRYAALKTWGVPHAQLAHSRELESFAYEVDARFYLLPLEDKTRYAFEQGGYLGWLATSDFSIRLGYRISLASYPVGTRFHWYPYVDLLFGLGGS